MQIKDLSKNSKIMALTIYVFNIYVIVYYQ